MDSIGAEVGQKMRSAIKAKLMELNCYVDDELPDYIMVMVANKRTKSQMNEDLQLFLNTKTSTFVDWLHIVLKKLKEVTVTNPDIYKKNTKRKSVELPGSVKVKKEKKLKKTKREDDASNESTTMSIEDISQEKSLTDDLPINANKLAEQRKIVIMNENKINNANVLENDGFDIPLLHEVNLSSEQELKTIEKKIRNVKSRLGLLVDSEDDEECLNIKAEQDDLLLGKEKEEIIQTPPRKIEIESDNSVQVSCTSVENSEKRSEHKRITFNSDDVSKKPSILDRLGKRPASVDPTDEPRPSKNRLSRISLSEFRKDEDKYLKSSNKPSLSTNKSHGKRKSLPSKESPLSRNGMMSKVLVPLKEPEEPEEEFINKEVPSVVKIKPRIIPSDTPQANKNLLLKAVADAQRSVAQTPTVGNNMKPDALFTKKFKEKSKEEKLHNSNRKLPEVEKNKLKNLIYQVSKDKNDNSNSSDELVSKAAKKSRIDFPKRCSITPEKDDGEVKQQFIITLDGIEKTKFKDLKSLDESPPKTSIKSRLEGRRTPSPIIFDKEKTSTITTAITTKPNIPDKLPIVHPPLSVKNKERCKYWPGCRQGDKCEFVHPTSNCEMFPQCKFGDKCLYLHPTCKFGSSCTKRDCHYSHNFSQKSVASRIIPPSLPIKLSVQSLQTCKFFPNCTNMNCSFYHPKPCKFGKYCKNQGDCNFSHTFPVGKSSLTWRSK